MSIVLEQNTRLRPRTVKNPTYKYDDTNWAGSQFPEVKTVNPPVRRMRMHMNNPAGEEYPAKG